MKKILSLLLIVFAVFANYSCSDDEEDDWQGFEKYEGVWGPAVYTLDGKEYECNPNYPNINLIDRVSFIKYEGTQVIVRNEYFNNGVWKHRYDDLFIFENGNFYETRIDGNGLVKGNVYHGFIISDGYLTCPDRQACQGIKFVKVE